MRNTTTILLLSAIASLLVATGAAEAAPDILIEDFEEADYGAWQVEGEAFGPVPAEGTLPDQMRVYGFSGRRLVNSYYGGDGATGTLTSPPFKVERPYINFQIGGGGHGSNTSVALLLDGNAVRVSSGPNTEPGGREELKWTHWEVSEFMDKEVQIQITDQQAGTWGHINADHFVQSDAPCVSEKTRTIEVQHRYLNIPVKNGATKLCMRLLQEGEIAREFEVELAPADPDFWVFLDLTPFQGKSLTLWADAVERDNKGFDAIQQADEIIGGEDLYREKYRPQFHFSSKRGWNNDPNGLVYYAGEYHLFYQHNPYGWNWGNMTWGHAVSKDLVRWEELGAAIHPDALGTIFSGSAVVDEQNTAGFQQGDEKTLVAAYTYAGDTSRWSEGAKFTQAIAYSNDRGRTWTKYEGNPVLGHIVGGNRDPKVIWHEPSKHWVMVLYLDDNHMGFFSSKDLKVWERQSELKCFYECPDLFPLPVDNDVNKMKWVLYGASGEYYLGEFDGKTFTPDGEALPFNYGNCFYASQTFNNIPSEDGRRIQIAWGSAGHKDMPFNQMMNFPVELSLRTTERGARLLARPVREIETLYTNSAALPDTILRDASQKLEYTGSGLMDISLVFENDSAAEFGVIVQGLTVTYDAGMGELRCDDKKAPLAPQDGKITLRLLLDRLSVEIFANDGQVYMPMKQVQEGDAVAVEVFAKGGGAVVTGITVNELSSAWEADQ